MRLWSDREREYLMGVADVNENYAAVIRSRIRAKIRDVLNEFELVNGETGKQILNESILSSIKRIANRFENLCSGEE